MTDSLIELSKMVVEELQSSLEFLKNDIPFTQDLVVKRAVTKLMAKTRGHTSPELLTQLCYLERSVYKGYDVYIQC